MVKHFLVVFLCLVSAGYVVSNDEGAIVRIPLEHMESGLERLARLSEDVKLIEGLYEMNRRGARRNPQIVMRNGKPVPTNDTLPLFKYFDTNYYGIVFIGKPGKSFKMVMDTAWSYSWVISNDCPRTLLPCAVHQRYDHDASKTYVPDGRGFNISNRYLGILSKDVFHVGQLNSTNQGFAELTAIPWIFSVYQTEGTVGLGFQDLSPGYVPFFFNFLQQNKLKQPIFSFYVNRDPTTKRGGSILFGGIDYKHNKTEFTTIDVVPSIVNGQITEYYYWQFKMDKVSVVMSKKESYDVCKSGCMALADTSANTIIGPADEIKKINNLIGADTVWISDRYMIRCNQEYKGPKISFYINGKEFQIKARDYIQKLSFLGVTLCLSAFQPAEAGTMPPNTWSLGGAFLYQYYTAFDINNHKIMIAEAA